ncbi:MAG: DUF4270 domain-containing protein [Chitinophagales bacterium]|nr:DUF4270 domain-containing protein [Chitinophagales bacterium]
MKKFIFPAFIFSFLIISCTKVSVTEIGSELIPPIDGVHTFDTTIDVQTFNILSDSFRISKLQEMVLGSITNDPLMGTTKAIINAEFKPNSFPFYFPVGKDSLTLDSAVLVLSYRGLWGDSTNPIDLKVYEISQSSKLNQDSIYTSYSSMNIARQIGSVHIADPRKLSDSVKAFSEDAINQIRIPLTSDFGNKLLKQFDSSNAYYSSNQFSSLFRGFSIIPQTGSNTLLRVSLTDTNSKVALYYKYKQRNGADTTVITYFRSGLDFTGASNNIVRNISGSQSEQYLINPPTTEDDLLFLQAGQGNFVRIKTPYVAGIKNRVVHRAELIMEQEADNDPYYNVYTAPNLFLCAISTHPDSAEYRFYIPKDIVVGQGGTVDNLNIFGGNVIYKTDPNGKRIASYSFNISRYVQSIITFNQKVFDLYLFAPVTDYVYTGEGMTSSLYPIATMALNAPACGRVGLLGGNNSQQNRKMRLRIIYSTL